MDFADLPAAEKPREKLLAHGPESLSPAELIAVLLRTGRTGEDVVEMSRRLIADLGGLEGLARATTAELMQEKGLKKAKAASLAAAIELGKRMSQAVGGAGKDWRTPLEAKAAETRYMERECIYAFFLDDREKFIGESVISYGGLSGAFMDLPYFFRRAARLSAAKVVLLHNHPDGCISPSSEDVSLTEHVQRGLSLLGMELKGHYIAAGGKLFPVTGADFRQNA